MYLINNIRNSVFAEKQGFKHPTRPTNTSFECFLIVFYDWFEKESKNKRP